MANIFIGDLTAKTVAGTDKIEVDTGTASNHVLASDLLSRANHTGTQGVATITGLGDSATKNTGTAAGTVAAGDHTHTGFASTTHAHVSTDVSDFAEAVDDRVASLTVAGTGIAKTYDDINNTLTLSTPDNASNQKVNVRSGGTSVGTRKSLNFIAGTNVTLGVADDATNDEVDITINSSGGASGYATVQDEGTSLTQRGTINFIGAGVSVADDATNGKTNVTITSGSGATIDDTTASTTTVFSSSKTNSTYAPTSHTHTKANITDFAHTHPSTEISDFAEGVDDRVNALIVAGTNITKTYDDANNTLTIAASGATINDTTVSTTSVYSSSKTDTLLSGKAASAHTHGVADLTATGTKDATTFLRGDNTWATPAGGGGSAKTLMNYTLPMGSSSLFSISNQGGTPTSFINHQYIELTTDATWNTSASRLTAGSAHSSTLFTGNVSLAFQVVHSTIGSNGDVYAGSGAPLNGAGVLTSTERNKQHMGVERVSASGVYTTFATVADGTTNSRTSITDPFVNGHHVLVKKTAQTDVKFYSTASGGTPSLLATLTTNLPPAAGAHNNNFVVYVGNNGVLEANTVRIHNLSLTREVD